MKLLFHHCTAHWAVRMSIAVVGAVSTSFIEAVVLVLRIEVREATSEDAKAGQEGTQTSRHAAHKLSE
jgi:hypothetical protein